MPWSIFPSAPPPNPTNHCKGGNGETKCTLVMAGFDLGEVPKNQDDLQYQKYNVNLLTWFNNSLKSFLTGFSEAERQRHFPWNGTEYPWETFYYPRAVLDPFLGKFENTFTKEGPVGPDCDVGVDGPTTSSLCRDTKHFRASRTLYPRQCTLDDLYGAATSTTENVTKLRKCGLNYELHPTATSISGRSPSGRTSRTWADREPIRQDVLPVRRRSRHADASAILQSARSDSNLTSLRAGA